jgi:hypothetical protein
VGDHGCEEDTDPPADHRVRGQGGAGLRGDPAYRNADPGKDGGVRLVLPARVEADLPEGAWRETKSGKVDFVVQEITLAAGRELAEAAAAKPVKKVAAATK